MTVYMCEVKRGLKSLLIWSVSVGGMILLCMLMYPEMEKSMDDISKMFANMGMFTAAFGMDRLNFGSAMGFYGIEGGNMIGIGGAFFAALLGISMLSKEEGGHTAEFLFTHPVSRFSVISSKLLAMLTQIIAFNVLCLLLGIVSFLCINEDIEWKKLLLFHIAQTIAHIEIGCICFGISSACKKNTIGVGIGMALGLYLINIFANLSDKVEAVGYITPFKYCDAANVFTDSSIELLSLCVGIGFMLSSIVLSYVYYCKRDLAA